MWSTSVAHFIFCIHPIFFPMLGNPKYQHVWLSKWWSHLGAKQCTIQLLSLQFFPIVKSSELNVNVSYSKSPWACVNDNYTLDLLNTKHSMTKVCEEHEFLAPWQCDHILGLYFDSLILSEHVVIFWYHHDILILSCSFHLTTQYLYILIFKWHFHIIMIFSSLAFS